VVRVGGAVLHPARVLCAAVGEAVAQVTGVRPDCRPREAHPTDASSHRSVAEVVELGVVNASIHKVNECVRVEDIDALHRMYVNVLRRLLA